MDYMVLAIALLLILLWVIWVKTTIRQLGRLPPGPCPLPIVGNLLQLDRKPQLAFARLASKYGSIMTVWLGSMSTVVISSDEAAREMYKNHDAVLAGRKIYAAIKGDFGHEGSMITSQYGPHLRLLRRLCTTEFFTVNRLDAMAGVRKRCIDGMLKYIEERSASGNVAIDVRGFFFVLAFNMIGNLIFSKDLLDSKFERGAKFFHHAGKVTELAGTPNVSDFIPALQWMDPQRIRKRTLFHVDKASGIAREFIEERMAERNNDGSRSDSSKDFLDVLLEFRGEETESPFPLKTINNVVVEMFTAGTDTTTSTLEWAMTELLHRPETLRRVQAEVRTIVGPDDKLEESHLKNLPYLKAVINETLRLHPPLPLLFPHKAMGECKMNGYCIPKDTQVLVNVWAIGRDSKNWKDPLEFRPERFLESENMSVDFKGRHFKFIPFGSGRRMCPAVPLASRVLPMALGSVLLSFDWSLPDGMKPTEMDMSDTIGITLSKAVPLKAIAVRYRNK